MNEAAALSRTERVGVGLCFIVFPLVWVFAFAVHPDLLHPRWLLGPAELIQRAHNNALLQFAHALVTLNAALAVVVTLHYRRLLRETAAAWYGLIGATCAVLGAVMLAADKGALCLTLSALDTLPQHQFDQAMPGLIAIFSFKGWMAITLGLVLMPIGVLIQAVGLATVHALPRRQLVLLFVGVAAIAFPDGAEIINLVAALIMAAAMVPYGARLLTVTPPSPCPGPAGATKPELPAIGARS